MSGLMLERRMERLEAANRRLELAILGVLAVVGAALSLAATEPAAKVVRAERFEVVDSQGKCARNWGPRRMARPN